MSEAELVIGGFLIGGVIGWWRGRAGHGALVKMVETATEHLERAAEDRRDERDSWLECVNYLIDQRAQTSPSLESIRQRLDALLNKYPTHEFDPPTHSPEVQQ